jgi:hypothetical protein
MEINHPLLVQCCICEKKRLLHEDSVCHICIREEAWACCAPIAEVVGKCGYCSKSICGQHANAKDGCFETVGKKTP